MYKFVSRIRTFAVVWLFFISVLFFLPGSALPKDKFLEAIYFDKWVHFGLFAVLLFLWRFYFSHQLKFTWLLLALSFCYGLGVELIQHYFILNRSFDLGDVVADMIGAVVGLRFWTKRYIKNRPL